MIYYVQFSGFFLIFIFSRIEKSHIRITYNFYCALQLNGEIDTRESMSPRTYQRNIKELKNAKIDFSQSYKIEEIEIFYFNARIMGWGYFSPY